MSTLSFEKYQGIGNDFVLIDARPGDALRPLASRLCDRHFGVGADGLLLVFPPDEAAHAARMRVVNADGSVPEMCGNGLRCVALHVARTLARETGTFVIETDAGPRACDVSDEAERGVVTVDMGPILLQGERSLVVAGASHGFAIASAGNPHAVTYEPASREEIRSLGPAVATHEAFADGTNVEFASLRSGGIDLVVWERGVGLTLACGTGACAAVAVACSRGLVPWDTPVRVSLPGGELAITVRRNDGHALLRGTAKHVFSGQIAIP